VFGVALLVRNKVLRLLLLFVFFAVSVAYGVLFGADGAMLGYYTNPIVMEFLFGAVLGALYVGGYLKRITVAQSVAIAVVATAFILPSFDFGTTTAGRVIVLGIPAAFLLLALVSLEQNGRLPRLPVLAALGDASYSIYLAHPFALTAAKLAVRSLELAADNAAIGMLVVATSVVFALGFGYLTHRLIELPMLEGLRRLLLSDREAATAGERRSAVVN
jgi:peptidoglycan/LPS O-acetylase OafA/YrhL